MRIIGIDPGLERMGWGVVEKNGSRLIPIGYGLIQTTRVETPQRLVMIREQLTELLAEHAPTCMAMERLFFAKNQTTVMDVARASGVAQLTAAEAGLSVEEYSPPQIKKSVCGTGSAAKHQVQFMVTRLLGLKEAPKPDDVADALAIAITHALRANPAAQLKP